MRRIPLTLAASLTLSAALLSFTVSAQQTIHRADRVTALVDTQQRHALGKHHLPAWAASSNDLGAVTADVSLEHLTVVLARSAESQAAFEQLLADQQNPSSPRYQQWLTPEQIGENYGLNDHDLNAVTGWLASQGLRVDAVSPDRTRITFSGTSSTVGRALTTEFHRYSVHTRRGEEQRLSINSEPTVPAALSGVIAGFHGLSEEHLAAQSIHTHTSVSRLQPELTGTSGGVTAHFVAPADFVKIYDIQPAYNAGINGSGVKVAIVGRSRVLASDITAFQTNTGLGAAQPVTIIPSTGLDPGVVCTSTSCDQGEQTLDVNRVMGTAPGAEADLVVSKDANTDDGLDIAISYEVDTLKDPILSISYGTCEADATQSNANYYNTLFSTASAAGITTFVASGDSAAAGCETADGAAPSTTPTASINLLCSSQYVTCVGGTEFADTASPSSYWKSSNTSALESALSYVPEGAWNEPGSGSNPVIFGTGGGPSMYITKPSWQTGTGVPSDNWRDTPDVALTSSLHDPYYGCVTDYESSGCTSSGTSFSFDEFAGTSAAAPGMAGIMALIVQKLGHAQGNFNPTIYRIANASTGVFHDATPSSSGVSSCSVGTASMCNNSAPSRTSLTGGLAGFELATGYDEATGWGSVDVTNLLAAVSSTYTLTPAPGALVISAPGSTTGNTFVVTATSLNSFAGTVPLTCSVTSNSGGGSLPTCSLSPSSVTLAANGTATTTVTIDTTGSSAKSYSPKLLFGSGGVLACMLLCLPLASRKKRAFSLLLALAAVFTLCGGVSGCGAGGTPAATATGNYTVTVFGTVADTVTSTTFSVTVN